MEQTIGSNSIYLDLVLRIDQPNRKEQYYHIHKQDTKEYVGNCGIRFDDNESNTYLGNIEYEIFEPYRSNHYSKQACLLLASIAYENGLKSLTITSNIKNKASLSIIESLGAKFTSTVRVPKTSRLYQQGDRYLNTYEWNIEEERKIL